METANYDHSQFQIASPNGGPQPGDETLLVKFFTKPAENKVKSAEQGRPIFEDKVFISIKIPGVRNEKVFPASDHYKARFPKHWEAYHNRTADDAVEGTPLVEWPIIKRSQAEELKFWNLQTVEQLATISDTAASENRGLITLREKAKAYLLASKDTAAINRLQGVEDENSTLKGEVAELKAMVESLKDQVVENAPKKRGRPPKEQTEE